MLKKLLSVMSLMLVVACETPGVDGDGSNNGQGGAGGFGSELQGVGGGQLAPGVSDTVYFSLDSSTLSSEAQAVLNAQAAYIKDNNVSVTVEGHADERGTREYNLALGERRANAVSQYLQSAGVSSANVTTISYGKERPVATGSDEASWALNRRAVTVKK